MKKVIAALLAVLLVVGMLPAALAAEIEWAPVSEQTETADGADLSVPSAGVTDTDLFGPSTGTYPESGECGAEGSSITWEIVYHRLVISGTGEMIKIPEDQLIANQVEAVYIGNGVTSIPADAFRDYTFLSEVVLPNTLREIGSYAFYNTSMTEIIIPNSVTTIGDFAFGYFEGTSSGSATELPVTDFGIGGYANTAAETYAKYNGFQFTAAKDPSPSWSGTVPSPSTGFAVSGECGEDGDNLIWTYSSTTNTLTVSGTGRMKTFPHRYSYPEYSEGRPWADYLPDITTIIIEEGVTNISNYAFEGATALTQVSLPSTLTEINFYAFGGCSSLSSIEFPENLTRIESASFRGTAITSLYVPKNVTQLGFYFPGGAEDADGVDNFDGCESLQTISVDPENPAYTAVDNVLFSKDMKTLYLYPMGKGGTSYAIPEGVEHIWDGAFLWCRNLKAVTLPSTLKRIDMNAFYNPDPNDGLTEITVPSSVTSIHSYAFGHFWDGTDVVANPNFVVRGYPDTAAEVYAESCGMTFIPINAETVTAEPEDVPVGYKIVTTKLSADDQTDMEEAVEASKAFDGMEVTYADITLVEVETDEETHDTRVKILINYPSLEIAEHYEDYTFTVLHGVRQPDGTLKVEPVSVTATPNGLLYEGTLSSFAIGYKPKESETEIGGSGSGSISGSVSGATNWNGTGAGSASNPLSIPTGADNVGAAIALLGVAAAALSAGAARVRKRK